MAEKQKKVTEDAQPTPAAQTITTKSAAMSGILAAMSSMSHDDMMKWFPDAMALAQSIGDGTAGSNQASIQMKPSDAVGSAMKEEANALFEGEDLNEEAKQRVLTLIEHAVDLRVSIEKEALEEEYQTKLVEEVVKVQEEMVEKIDSYATYAAEQWIEKNEVAIESALKIERADKLLEGLRNLFQECNVEVPDEKVDVVESLEAEVAELTKKLNEAVEDSIAAQRELKAVSAMGIFKEISEGLTPIQAEKFKSLVEDVDVDGDLDDLRKKLTIIKEAHFRPGSKSATTGIDEAVVLTEDELKEQAKIKEVKEIEDPRVRSYAQAISRASNRYNRGPYSQ